MSKVFSFLKYKRKTKKERELELERAEIMEAINEIKMRLSTAQTCLEFALDEALIDSIIYEIFSLQRKYDYYLKICKDKSFSVDFIKIKRFSVS